MTLAHGCGLVSLVSIVLDFGTFLENLEHFEDQLFLVTTILLEDHLTLCA